MDEMVSDAAEWSSALAGDPSAFSRIFTRHRDRVFRHSVRLVPAAADADDVVAVVFFEAWRHREAIRFVDGSMLPWLLLTATNTARNLRRAAHRHRQLLEGLPVEDHTADATDPAGDEASAALRGLSLNDQRVITLCVLEDYSEEDAATVLGVPRGTVKSRLSRARRRLADAVRPTDQTCHLPVGELS